MHLDRYETNSTRDRLTGQLEQRGWKLGFSGIATWLFGGIFVAAGTAIILVGLKVIAVNPSTVHAPYPILTTVGAVFAAAGLYIWALGSAEWRTKIRMASTARLHPDEPAYRDYCWDSNGFVPSRWAPALKAFGFAAFMMLFLSVFNWWAFINKGPFMVKLITGIFDLITVFVWIGFFKRVWHAFKFTGSRISFAQFPYRVGQSTVLNWHLPTGVHSVTKGSFTLRCVEQWFEERGSGDNRNRHIVQEQLWSGTWSMDVPRSFGRGEQIELRFDPPADMPGTMLSADKPIFWELEIKLDVPGLDFHERYLVPIYKR